MCMTKVGAALNLTLDDGTLFTVDLVPSFTVKVKRGFTFIKLRQVCFPINSSKGFFVAKKKVPRSR